MADAKPSKDARDAKADPKADTKGGGKDAAPAAAQPRGAFLKKLMANRKLMIIAGVGTALTLAGGGAAAYLLLGKKHDDAQVAEHEARDGKGAKDAKGKEGKGKADKRAKDGKPPVFVELEPFTVNLRDEDADRYMQVKLVFEVKDNATGEQMKVMMPALRNEILLLLSSKQAAEVASREGKEQLARDLVLAASKPLSGSATEDGIDAVHFSQLIVQ